MPELDRPTPNVTWIWVTIGNSILKFLSLRIMLPKLLTICLLESVTKTNLGHFTIKYYKGPDRFELLTNDYELSIQLI